MADITKVEPRPGVIDSLVWTFKFQPSFFGTERALLWDWQGSVVLYRDFIPTGQMPPATVTRLTLPARWINRDTPNTRVVSTLQYSLDIETPLPGDALFRIEQFRHGERLYARVEGQFMAFKDGIITKDVSGNECKPTVGIIDHLTRHTNVWVPVHAECFQLSQDTWCNDVLPILRPPGKALLECYLPKDPELAAVSKSALAEIAKAQRLFDHGWYEETTKSVYKALEHLQSLYGPKDAPIAGRYHGQTRDAIKKQIGSLLWMSNFERHAGSPGTVDRAFAQCVLLATKALFPVFHEE